MDKDMLSECFILLQVGDKAAFVRIYEEYKRPVYTIIFRILRNSESAEDITQELFVKLYTNPPDRTVNNYRAWIFAMARNMAIDAFRREKQREAEKYEDAYEQTEGIVLKLDIEKGISRLSLEEREILTLHINCGLTFSEISKITKLSLPCVYRRYRSAIKSLRGYFGGGYL